MALLDILVFPDPRLRTVAQPIQKFDAALARFSEDLLETMYQAQGVGLAATQVNVHKRILAADVSEPQDQPMILVNPIIMVICLDQIQSK